MQATKLCDYKRLQCRVSKAVLEFSGTRSEAERVVSK